MYIPFDTLRSERFNPLLHFSLFLHDFSSFVQKMLPFFLLLTIINRTFAQN